MLLPIQALAGSLNVSCKFMATIQNTAGEEFHLALRNYILGSIAR